MKGSKKTLFIRTKHNMRIFEVIPFIMLQNEDTTFLIRNRTKKLNPKQERVLVSFFAVYLLVKCRFVAWNRGLTENVYVMYCRDKHFFFFNIICYVFGSCFSIRKTVFLSASHSASLQSQSLDGRGVRIITQKYKALKLKAHDRDSQVYRPIIYAFCNVIMVG